MAKVLAPTIISLSQVCGGLKSLWTVKERVVTVFLLTEAEGRRGTSQHGVLSTLAGEETGPAGVIFTVMDGPKPPARTDRTAWVPLDLAGAAQLRYSGNLPVTVALVYY
jgi:hypothetical protein